MKCYNVDSCRNCWLSGIGKARGEGQFLLHLCLRRCVDTLSSHLSLCNEVSLHRIFPVISAGKVRPSGLYTPLTADSNFLFVKGPSATDSNSFMKPIESSSSVLFQGSPSIFVSLGLVPISNFTRTCFRGTSSFSL